MAKIELSVVDDMIRRSFEFSTNSRARLDRESGLLKIVNPSILIDLTVFAESPVIPDVTQSCE